MHYFITLLAFLFITSYSTSVLSENDIAITVFKEHTEIQNIINKNIAIGNKISFDSIIISGQCGVAGCGWDKLVSLIITTTRTNPRTITHSAIVSGMTPERSKPRVKFIDLSELY